MTDLTASPLALAAAEARRHNDAKAVDAAIADGRVIPADATPRPGATQANIHRDAGADAWVNGDMKRAEKEWRKEAQLRHGIPEERGSGLRLTVYILAAAALMVGMVTGLAVL